MNPSPGPAGVTSKPTRIIVTDFDIPFWSVVNLMIKWGLAAIPAVILLTAIVAFFGTLFVIFFGIEASRSMPGIFR